MANSARLSGYDPNDAKSLAEFDALNGQKDQRNLSLMDKCKLFVQRVVEAIGFFRILASASIPNPLFVLAGINCGHFLGAFWTFIAFNETLIERALVLLALLPYFGS